MTPKQMQQAAAKVAAGYLLGGGSEVDRSRDATAYVIAAAIEAIVIEEAGEADVERLWKCGALTYRGPEPQDCNWPYCGCDPKATEVLQALDEHGYDLVDRHAALAAIQGGEG